MTRTSPVRLGIIGLGNMGRGHLQRLLSGEISRVAVTAVANAAPLAPLADPAIAVFRDADALIASGRCDAVLIATPHYHHPVAGIAALNAGLHVLVEKPLAVHRAECERLIAAHTDPRQVFAVVLNQRTDPRYLHLRELIRSGQLGAVGRVQLTVTDWFRPDAYYASSAWRATWAGEGGGVLINQTLHNLDLLQWLFGLPTRVRGFCQFGRYHAIEVEDDVTAYFEYADGAHATLITTTGEAPGTNRLEVAAENGRVVIEGDRFTFTRNKVPMSAFSRTATEPFAMPPNEELVSHFPTRGGQHGAIVQNFVDAILDGTPLIGPGADGLHSVELANAILLSAWTDRAVNLPLDGAVYADWLERKIAESARARSEK